MWSGGLLSPPIARERERQRDRERQRERDTVNIVKPQEVSPVNIDHSPAMAYGRNVASY